MRLLEYEVNLSSRKMLRTVFALGLIASAAAFSAPSAFSLRRPVVLPGQQLRSPRVGSATCYPRGHKVAVKLSGPEDADVVFNANEGPACPPWPFTSISQSSK